MNYEEVKGALEYELEIDYPYGTFEHEFVWSSPKGSDDAERNSIPENEKEFAKILNQEPIPISMAQLKEMHA